MAGVALVGAALCPEIIKDPRLALMGFGRRLGAHIRRRADAKAKKKSYIDRFIPPIGIALKGIPTLSDKEEGKIITTVLRDILERSGEKMV